MYTKVFKKRIVGWETGFIEIGKGKKKVGIRSVRPYLDEILEILGPFSPEVKSRSSSPEKGCYEMVIGDIKIDCSFAYGESRTILYSPRKLDDGIVCALKEYYF